MCVAACRLMISIVLNTDMAGHSKLVESARCLASANPDADIWADNAKPETRLMAMQVRSQLHV